MKKAPFIFVALSLILAACGSTTPAPTTGGGSGGTKPSPSPTPPSQPAPSPTPPSSSYPYNPDANAVQSKDSRVPYYGEWAWAVVFSTGDTFVGEMSIAVKTDEATSLKNMGGGLSKWCTSGTLTGCNFGNDIGLIGTYVNSGKAYLSASHFDSAADTVKWVGFDTNGKVEATSSGKPSISGQGEWFFYDGSDAAVAFAVVQASTTPSVKPKAASLPSAAKLSALTRAKGPISTQAMNAMQGRALAAASALADRR